jgi:hypothetical protein
MRRRGFDLEPRSCGVCGALAWWLGYAPNNHHEIMWLCCDFRCHKQAEKVYKMSNSMTTGFEKEALLNGGGKMVGAYLDELGLKFTRDVTAEEWHELLRCVFVGTSEYMRNEIPF